MESLPERIDSKFRFVLLAAGRAEQILRGAKPKDESLQGKPTRIAMQEIEGGMVEWDYGPAPVAEAPAEGETAVAEMPI
jgi:DNA-directed RNA polymerase omega subunit